MRTLYIGRSAAILRIFLVKLRGGEEMKLAAAKVTVPVLSISKSG
jgi:hypothetical protein